MVKRELTPRRAAEEMRGFSADEACGVLFGPERTGLVNDQIALADTVVSVPLNPAFSSLNLAQAVLIVGYEWFTARTEAEARDPAYRPQPAANKAELLRFFEHFEEGAVPERLSAPPRQAPEHDAQPAQPVSARPLHRAGGCAPSTASSPPSWGQGSGRGGEA